MHSGRSAVIATVRIAPVKYWCRWYGKDIRKHPQVRNLVGMPVNIITNSMRPASCDPKARMWDLLPESWERIDINNGGKREPDGKWGICEHMLEMD